LSRVAVGNYCDHTVARNLEGKSAALPFRRPVAKHLPHLVSTPCLRTLSPRFVGYASSPHFVPTLCRKRKSKRQKCSRPGFLVFVLVLVLVLEPRYCRDCRRLSGALRVRLAGTASPYLCWRASAGAAPRVARTFLSAHPAAGRQECLPHTATLHHCG